MIDGAVSDATRIQAAMPTIRELSDRGASVLLLAHFGRPKGAKNPTQSLSLVMGGVEDVLGHSVMFIPEAVGEGAKAGIAVLRSEEHTSELQSLMRNSYAVSCLKKKNKTTKIYLAYTSDTYT